MSALMQWVARLRRAAEVVATAMFAAIFVLFIFSIFMRYGLNRPIAWADEVNIILMIWMTFLAGALVLKEKEHVMFDIVWSAVSPPTRRAMGLLGAVLIGGLFVAAFPATWSYVNFVWRERTSVLEWRLDFVYSIYLVFVACVIIRFGWTIKTLLGKGWSEAVKD
jgi:TRAP-type C4-dicarboxylate transport system permease small subunit